MIDELTPSPTWPPAPPHSTFLYLHTLLQHFSFLQGPSGPSSLVSDGRLHPTPSYVYTCVPLASPGSPWLFTVTYAGKPPLSPQSWACPSSWYVPFLALITIIIQCWPWNSCFRSASHAKVWTPWWCRPQLSCVFTTKSQVPRAVFLKL